MEFLLPRFTKITHRVNVEQANTSKEYPSTNAFLSLTDYRIPKDVGLAIVEENLGLGCRWSEFIVIDPEYSSAEYFNKRVFIPNNQVKNISGKDSFTPICSVENAPNKNAQQLDPSVQELYIPYVDNYNGYYSVRVQVDQEKVLDSFVLANLLEEVYLEGVQILLDSRGYRSDNDAIESLRSKYNTFAYIHNDLDLTVSRFCEPLTFTVSIPLRFFNIFESAVEIPEDSTAIEYKLVLNNKTFNSNIDKLLRCITSKSGDFLQLTYPNKFIEGFILDFEVAAIKKFAVAFNQLTAIAGYPLSSRDIIEYEIDLDRDLNIVGITIFSQQIETKLNKSIVSQFRTRGEFNSKRILNYLLSLESISANIVNIEAIDFINSYVRYPEAKIVENKVVINGKTLTTEQVSKFKLASSAAEEVCVNFTDISAAFSAGAIFSDTIFHLFIDKTAGNTNIDTVFGNIKSSFKNLEKELESQEKSLSINVQIKDGASAAFNAIKEKYAFNLNTLTYILNRLNINKILFQHIFCLLKGLNPNDPRNPEVADILSRMPIEILNYFQYYQTIKNLKGTEYVKALSAGLNFNAKLFCTKNAEIIYFVKGLVKFVQALNGIGTVVINAVDSLNSLGRPAQNPYKALTENIISSLESVSSQLVIDLIKEMLVTSCEDDLFDPATNYQNPFNSHQPISRFGGSEDTNSTTLKNNRLNALNNSMLNPLQYGLDEDYVVDLIGLLLNDVNCILTLQESLELLRGEPSDLVITLITNLIRNKYSAEPNNLSYLLTNSEQLKLFFRELGLTVNEFINEPLAIPTTERFAPSNVCDVERVNVRQNVIENKVPVDLGVLERQLANRSKRARKLFEYIAAGGITEIDISPLCPELEDADILAAKENIVANYRDYLENTFSNVISSFTDESDNLAVSFSEEKQLFRRDSSGNLIDGAVYHTYQSDLNMSLQDPAVGGEQENKSDFYIYLDSNNEYAKDYKIKFKSRSMTNNALEGLIFLLGAEGSEAFNVTCFDNSFTASSDFEKFLEEESLFVEFTAVDFLFDDEEDGSDLRELYSAQDDTLASILRNKKYFYTISIDYELTTEDEINFKFIYNDKINKRYRILSEKPSKESGVINENYTTTNFRDNLNANSERFSEPSPNRHPRVYQLTKDTFNLLGDKEKQVIQGMYVQYFKKFLSSIENYEKTVSTVEKLQVEGIFNITTNYDENLKTLNKTLNVVHIDSSGSVQESEYFSVMADAGSFNYKEALSVSRPERSRSELDNAYKNYFSLYSKLVIGKGVDVPKELGKYLKGGVDTLQEFIYVKDTGIISTNIERVYPETYYEAYTFLSDKKVQVRENPELNDVARRYAQLKQFNLTQTISHKNCNIFPHYLNLPYFINISLNSAKQELCESNLDSTLDDCLDEIIVNLTARAYTTDILIKAIPYLTLLNSNEFNLLYSKKSIVEIVRKFIEKEMQVFSPTPQNQNYYYKYFLNKVDKIYGKYARLGKIKSKFKVTEINSQEDRFNYFISREIAHFTKFCKTNKIINLLEYDKDIFDYLNSNFFLEVAGSTIQAYRTHEFDSFFMYVVMANTVNPTIRTIFNATKAELAKIFSSTVVVTAEDSGQVSFTEQEKSQEDLEKFLKNLAYSPNPAAMVMTKPEYTKYIKFAVNSGIASLRQFLLNLSQTNNTNIRLTRFINKISSTVATLSWGMIDQETRTKLILESPDLASLFIYKRMEDGRSISPDGLTSLVIATSTGFTVYPDIPGYAYLLLDSVQEAQYYFDSINEIRQMKGLKVDDDPCQSNIEVQTESVDASCNPQKRQKLINEINEYENL